jgi:hypothetical protein
MFRRSVVTWSCLLLAGCEAPEVAITAADSARADVAIDVADAAETIAPGEDAGITDVFFADGAPCRGHDEDHDGIPDLCDDCPGTANNHKPAIGKPAIGTVCSALASDGVRFDLASKRLFFDPFTEYGTDWKASGGGDPAFQIEGGDEMAGGSGAEPDFRYIVRRAAAGAGVTVATTVFEDLGAFESPFSGIFVRAVGDPKRFIMCALGPGSIFGIRLAPPTGCSGGPCDVALLTQKPVPAELYPRPPGRKLGLRISVSSGAPPATTGRVECLIFDPDQPISLHNADERFILRYDLDETQWIPSGEVGLGLHRLRSTFSWIDVFTEPTTTP